MAKPDPVRAYMEAHPERVHQGVVPVPVVSRARDQSEGRESSVRGVVGWCSITGRPVVGGAATGGVEMNRHAAEDHPEVRGCRVEVETVERDGLWVRVRPAKWGP